VLVDKHHSRKFEASSLDSYESDLFEPPRFVVDVAVDGCQQVVQSVVREEQDENQRELISSIHPVSQDTVDG